MFDDVHWFFKTILLAGRNWKKKPKWGAQSIKEAVACQVWQVTIAEESPTAVPNCIWIEFHRCSRSVARDQVCPMARPRHNGSSAALKWTSAVWPGTKYSQFHTISLGIYSRNDNENLFFLCVFQIDLATSFTSTTTRRGEWRTVGPQQEQQRWTFAQCLRPASSSLIGRNPSPRLHDELQWQPEQLGRLAIRF